MAIADHRFAHTSRNMCVVVFLRMLVRTCFITRDTLDAATQRGVPDHISSGPALRTCYARVTIAWAHLIGMKLCTHKMRGNAHLSAGLPGVCLLRNCITTWGVLGVSAQENVLLPHGGWWLMCVCVSYLAQTVRGSLHPSFVCVRAQKRRFSGGSFISLKSPPSDN